jgi:hypothetical protein
MSKKLLSIYLNDHLAGATVGLELARRARGANEGTPLGEMLAGLEREIDEDRDSLKALMSKLGVREDPLKVAAGWAAEKAGRLKLNGQLTGYSPLSRLVELEGLYVGVTGKLSLWKNLEATHGERIGGIDIAALSKRAESQRRRLATARRKAAEEAIST